MRTHVGRLFSSIDAGKVKVLDAVPQRGPIAIAEDKSPPEAAAFAIAFSFHWRAMRGSRRPPAHPETPR